MKYYEFMKLLEDIGKKMTIEEKRDCLVYIDIEDIDNLDLNHVKNVDFDADKDIILS